jgi:hypothetical protein
MRANLVALGDQLRSRYEHHPPSSLMMPLQFFKFAPTLSLCEHLRRCQMRLWSLGACPTLRLV